MVATPDKLENCSILITDDDSASRDTLSEVLQTEGFHTVTASCGEEAVDVVQVTTVHLVLMDMHMPTLSGLDTLRLVRQLHAELPAILVTGDPTDLLVRQAIRARCFSVLPKPVNKHLLLYTVLKALSRFYGIG
jgi:two-component system chemotaxis response regulator CheY